MFIEGGSDEGSGKRHELTIFIATRSELPTLGHYF